MVNLYEYNNATKEECLEDLNETLQVLLDYNYIYDDNIYDDFDLGVLERRGQRLQYIAQRLKELEGE